MPASTLRVVQLGDESTWGTAVVATVKLMGVTDASIEIADGVMVAEEVGFMGPSARAGQATQSGTGSLAMNASYEDLPYLLGMLFGEATPSGSGPYTRAYAAPTTTAAAAADKTIEFGAPAAAYKLAGALVTGLTASIEAAALSWTVSADIIGKLVSTVTLAALAERTVEMIRPADTALFVDAAAGTIGSTAAPATLISAELAVNANRHTKTFVGSLSPSAHGDARWDVGLTLVLEFNATAKAYVDALLSGVVERQIRLIATSGTKTVTVDFAGVVVDGAQLFADRDGNMTVSLTWAGKYNTALGNSLKVVVVNAVAVLA